VKRIIDHVKRPTLYEPHTKKFWDDEHISRGMLEAHLDKEMDAASRPADVIDASVSFIARLAPPARYPSLCDLGCGPGLYTKRFHEQGYAVTGYDISPRSIDHARAQNDAITYRLKSYLELDETAAFDVVTLIYCDFAVLSPEDRSALLRRIHRALTKDGLFMLDVHTEHFVDRLEEEKTWYHETEGFFSDSPHVCLHARYKYEHFVFVDQYTLIDEHNRVEVIRNWNKGYSVETLQEELSSGGFHYVTHYEDFTGKPFKKDSPTLMMVVKKEPS